MFHEQSKQHLEKKRDALDRTRRGQPTGGDDMKANIQKMRDQSNTKMMDEMRRIEEAAISTYDKTDATGFRYKRLDYSGNAPGSRGMGGSLAGFDQDLGYKKP